MFSYASKSLFAPHQAYLQLGVRMYSFRSLDAKLLSRFRGLTYPRYQKLFDAESLPDRTIAIGALYIGQPVGLVLGVWSENGQIGQVLSFENDNFSGRRSDFCARAADRHAARLPIKC